MNYACNYYQYSLMDNPSRPPVHPPYKQFGKYAAIAEYAISCARKWKFDIEINTDGACCWVILRKLGEIRPGKKDGTLWAKFCVLQMRSESMIISVTDDGIPQITMLFNSD